MADQQKTSGATQTAPEFEDGAVRVALRDAVPTREFLANRSHLSVSERLEIVSEALVLFRELYVHLPLKRAMYAVDPVRRLQLLELRLTRLGEAAAAREQGKELPPDITDQIQEDLWFHREMSTTLTSVRDLHTVYALPEPFKSAIAFVPFQIEDYFVNGERRFAVANVIDGLDWFDAPESFIRGVEVTHWSGVPTARAVELSGERNAGNNPDAKLGRGLARLTIRPLAKTLPPDEDWVTLHYIPEGQKEAVPLTVGWRVAKLAPEQQAPADGTTLREATGEGMDQDTDMIRQVRKAVYAAKSPGTESGPTVRAQACATAERPAPIRDVRQLDGVPDWFQARVFRRADETDQREYAVIRLRSFKVASHEAFLDAFIELLDRIPEGGLIIDVRDNPGGYIRSGERLLQTLTPRRIEPEPLQFLNSPLSLQLTRLLPECEEWADSIERSMETSTSYSCGFPITPAELCNDKGQRYHGPVALITNALSYSTTDIFAAGFQDHEIGPVIGTDASTGAGGANVISHAALNERFTRLGAAARRFGNPVPEWRLRRELPQGCDLRVAMRRTLRVGRQAGVELEDLGVRSRYIHRMTRDDLLNGNIDLIGEAARLLSERPSYRLKLASGPERKDGRLTAEIETRGFDRLEIFVDGWATGSQAVRDGRNTIEVAAPADREKMLELRGYRTSDGERVQVATRKVPVKILTVKAAAPSAPAEEPEPAAALDFT